jgi:hypothetical protein
MAPLRPLIIDATAKAKAAPVLAHAEKNHYRPGLLQSCQSSPCVLLRGGSFFGEQLAVSASPSEAVMVGSRDRRAVRQTVFAPVAGITRF